MHLYIYAKFLNITYSAYIILILYMRSGLNGTKEQLICSSLGKTISPIPSFPQSSIVLYVRFRSHVFLSVQFGMSIDAVFVQLAVG